MITHELSIDYDVQDYCSHEQQLFYAILLTFIEDVEHIKRITIKYSDRPLPQSVRYNELHPYIELHSLVYEINGEWTETICDLAKMRYPSFRLKLLKLIEEKLGRRFY